MKILPIAFLLTISLFTRSLSAQTTAADSSKKMIEVHFERVEVEASFPGGPSAWLKFLTKTVNGSVPTDNNAPSGTYTVVIQFVVDKDSSISEFKALTKHGYGMEEEVIRALRLSGKWIPAMQNGRIVKAYRKQPVTFNVEMDGLDIITEKYNTLFTKKDNPVTIKVEKVKDEDLLVTVTGGTVTKAGNGQYIIKVSKPGRMIIRVYNTKKDKEIGAAIYNVE